MSYLRYGITTGRSFKKIHRRKQKIIKANQRLVENIQFRFHKSIIMDRTLGDFAVEKAQNTTSQESFISKHLLVGEAPH